jgi:hypothetical protein
MEMVGEDLQEPWNFTLAINEDTLAAPCACNEDLWGKAVTSVSMLLLSPEQLTSRCFDHLLQKKAFLE